MSDGRGNGGRDRVFDALADPTRRQIVEILAPGQEVTISDIARHFPISRQAVTKHLGVLEEAGVIAIEAKGRERVISLRPASLETATRWLDDVGRQWDVRLQALRDHLEKGE